MKHNFTLSKDNVGDFIKRFEKLQSKTGLLTSQTFYNRKNHDRILKSIGITTNILNITKTIVCYHLSDKTEFDTFPSNIVKANCKKQGELDFKNPEVRGIILINSDSCMVVYYGQKIKFTPSQIILIDVHHESWDRNPSTQKRIFNVSSQIEKAIDSNRMDEIHAAEYWEDIENGLWDDIDADIKELEEIV